MPELERDGELEMPYGVRLRSVGMSATVDVVPAATAGTPVRAVAPGAFPDEEGMSDRLVPVIEAAGMRSTLAVPLENIATSPGAAGPARAIADEAPHLEMSVPAPDPDEGQVVLEIDAAGLMRWHVDVDAAATAAAIADGTAPAPSRDLVPTRATAEQTFRIPVEQLETGDGRRGLLGFGIRKVLHLIRFPIESAAAAAGKVVVGWWEDRNRPHALQLLTPENVASVPPAGGVDAARLAELADRPFLLLVHGTFSTIRGGFAGLSEPGEAPGLPELIARYQGRVLGFDHQTLHVDPAFNASWFLGRLPRDRPLTLDVLAHSRGGLVGRRIADPDLAAAAGVPAPNVRRLIHVGTPNNGTVLASPKRWTTLIDVFSNLFALLPDEPATATAEAVIELVKQIAAGVFTGLSGLTAMDPADPSVAQANVRSIGGGAQGIAGAVRAIASDFTPAAGNLKLAALNALVDPFFGSGNDLVVPTQGVYEAGAYRVSDPYVVPSANAVVHTAFFRDPQVRAKLGEWLPG